MQKQLVTLALLAGLSQAQYLPYGFFLVPGLHTEYSRQTYDNSDGLQRRSQAESINGFSFGAQWTGFTLTYTYAQSGILNLVPFLGLASGVASGQVTNTHRLRLDCNDGTCDIVASLKLFPGGTWTDQQGAQRSFRSHDFRVEMSIHDTSYPNALWQMGGATLLGYRTFRVPRSLTTTDPRGKAVLAKQPVITDATHLAYMGVGKPFHPASDGFYATGEVFLTFGTGPCPIKYRSQFFNDTTDLRGGGQDFDLALRAGLEVGWSGYLGSHPSGFRLAGRAETDLLIPDLSATRHGLDWERLSGSEQLANTFYDVTYTSSPSGYSLELDAWVGF